MSGALYLGGVMTVNHAEQYVKYYTPRYESADLN